MRFTEHRPWHRPDVRLPGARKPQRGCPAAEVALLQMLWPAGTCPDQHRDTTIRPPDEAIDGAPGHDIGILKGKRHLKKWFVGL
jgi:hypothetical protein